jgi:hypothetical protein
MEDGVRYGAGMVGKMRFREVNSAIQFSVYVEGVNSTNVRMKLHSIDFF